MRALYPKPVMLPSLLALLALPACDQQGEARDIHNQPDPWPNEHEVIFQEAETLKYTLQQQELEAQRLREADLPQGPTAPRD